MTHDTWFCADCQRVRELDCHARCASCGSDSLTPAYWQELALQAKRGITYAVKEWTSLSRTQQRTQ